MNQRPKPPADYDENPPLGEDFFAEARPALEDAELARALAAKSLEYREALRSIIEAHEAGKPLDRAIADARAALTAAQ